MFRQSLLHQSGPVGTMQQRGVVESKKPEKETFILEKLRSGSCYCSVTNLSSGMQTQSFRDAHTRLLKVKIREHFGVF